jgi:D-glycero-D-manno-heptose 1,7-bisphosphate phosphatase
LSPLATERRPPVRVVFLDRDGTLNRKAADGDYVKHPSELELLPGASAAVRRLNQQGVRVVVVTNQRGIALGRMSERDLEAIHLRLAAELARAGATVDAIYHCPHDRGVCTCRKPAPGLFYAARHDRPQIDFRESAVIGDSLSDVEPGVALGMITVLVHPEAEALAARARARGMRVDPAAPSLAAAVTWLMNEGQ